MIKQFKLKRRIKNLLEELDLSPSFNAASLCRRLRKKGYNISLCLMPMPPGLESTYILCNNTHIIFLKESASPFRQHYLIFHELAHIILGHRKLHEEELLRGGTLYSRWEEREAEMFASLLMEAAFASKERAGIFSEHFQQALALFPQKSPPLEGQGWVEEMESLKKIAAFFQRFDAL